MAAIQVSYSVHFSRSAVNHSYSSETDRVLALFQASQSKQQFFVCEDEIPGETASRSWRQKSVIEDVLGDTGISLSGIQRAVHLTLLSADQTLSPLTKDAAIALTRSKIAQEKMSRQMMYGYVVTTLLTLMPGFTAFTSSWAKKKPINDYVVKALVGFSAPSCNWINYVLTGTMPDHQVRAVDAAQHYFSSVEAIFHHMAASILELSAIRPDIARSLVEQIDLATVEEQITKYFPKDCDTGMECFIRRCCRPLKEVQDIVLRSDFQRVSSLTKLFYQLLNLPHFSVSFSTQQDPQKYYETFRAMLRGDRFLPDSLPFLENENREFETFVRNKVNVLQCLQLTYLAELSENDGSPFTQEACSTFGEARVAKIKGKHWLKWGGGLSTLFTLIPFFTFIPSTWSQSQEDDDNASKFAIANAILAGFANFINLRATGSASDEQINAFAKGKQHFMEMFTLYENLAVALLEISSNYPLLARFLAKKIDVSKILSLMEKNSFESDLAVERECYKAALQTLEISIECLIQGKIPQTASPMMMLAYHSYVRPLSSERVCFPPHVSMDIVRISQEKMKLCLFLPEEILPELEQSCSMLASKGVDLQLLQQLMYLTLVLPMGKNSPFSQHTHKALEMARNIKEGVTNALSKKGLLATTFLSITSGASLISADDENQKKILAGISLVSVVLNAGLNLYLTGFYSQKRIRAVDHLQYHYEQIKRHYEALAITLVKLHLLDPNFAKAIAAMIQPRAISDKMLESFLPDEKAAARQCTNACGRNLWAARNFVLSGRMPHSNKDISFALNMMFKQLQNAIKR